jgi:hypothetical protein
LNSTVGFACDNNAEKKSHTKEATSDKMKADSCTKDCCKKTNDSKKGNHDCDGKCSHTNCTTSILQLSIPTSNVFDFQNNIFNFLIEKSTSFYNEANISDGFTSIWLRPKI